MQSFIIELLLCSISMSAIALIFMAVTPFLLKRYHVKWCYYGWLIIIMALIIPFQPHFNSAIVDLKISEESMQILPAWSSLSNDVYFEPINNSADVGFLAQLPSHSQPIPAHIPGGSIWLIILFIWLLGVAVFLSWQIMRHRRFIKLTRRWSKPITDDNLWKILRDLQKQLGISRKIDFQECCCLSSPTLIGIVKPVILL